jgi:hypothetical protein
MKTSLLLFALLISAPALLAQAAAPAPAPLVRTYHAGQTLTYHMTATNDGRPYSADATAVPQQTAAGTWIEDFRWTAMTSSGQPVALSPAMAEFREPLSLDPGWMPSGPDMHQLDHRMTGPVLDLMTFYIDLWLANKVGALRHAGDHFYLPLPQVGSWADGSQVLLGQSQTDFDFTLESIDPAQHTALLVVRHVPPPHPNVPLPAPWMQTNVANTANNWVQITRTSDGKYQAGAGQESFTDRITVNTTDGRILSATMENQVVISGRDCQDAALTRCGPAQPQTIHRHIEIALVH